MTVSTSVEATTSTKPRLWIPDRILFTPAALEEAWGQQILKRVQALGLPSEQLPCNRLTGLRGESDQETYDISKRTLAVVNAPIAISNLAQFPPRLTGSFI